MIPAAVKFESGWHGGVGTSSCLDLTLGSAAEGSTGQAVHCSLRQFAGVQWG